ncbi:hypothetical protein SALBM217S_00911 [Streptomyces griseoloalbus]
MTAVSVDAALVDGLLHVAAEAQGVVRLLEVTEDRCRGEYGFDVEACLFGEACEAASDGRVADYLRSGVAGECATRFKILSVDDQGVPVRFGQSDPRAWPGCAMKLYKSVCGFGHMHQDSVDLGPVHRARLHGQGMHVPFADFNLMQTARTFASLGEHGRVTVNADYRAAVPDTFCQRWQIGAGAAPYVKDGLARLDVQQVQHLLLVRTAGITGSGPQHVGSLVGTGHTKSR